ncbi:MAG TPA: hypothetical protein VFT22_10285 [Kofleriaceae bacterium]|nr:hypothetical protein [Kofleriaceae bacterium]
MLKAIDPRVEPALKVLARDGLPSPAGLELGTLAVCGVPQPDLTRFELEEDGSLTLKIERSPLRIRDVDPNAWSPSDVAVTLAGGEELILDQGAVHTSGWHFSVDGSSPNLTDARIDAWAWHVDAPPGTAVLWAARVRFTSPKPPIVLWYPDGNLRFRVADDVVRGWQFQTPGGAVFLVLRDEEWFVAFESSTAPGQSWVTSVMNSMGFVVGEPLNIGLLHAVGASSVVIGMARYMLVPWASHQDCEAPAVPVQAGATAIVAFIEGIIRFDVNEPGSPLPVAIHHFFESLTGTIETKFLGGWIAAEALAKWAGKNGRLRTVPQQRIADHEAWERWLRTHEDTIKGFAIPGKGQSLFDRVKSSDQGRQNAVQCVFKGEGIDWTQEMEDGEDARNSVAHEGRMPDAARDWEMDFSRVGLVRTMLTALMARLVGYSGPIADRVKTYNNLTGKEQPMWWHPSAHLDEVEYVDAPMMAAICNASND